MAIRAPPPHHHLPRIKMANDPDPGDDDDDADVSGTQTPPPHHHPHHHHHTDDHEKQGPTSPKPRAPHPQDGKLRRQISAVIVTLLVLIGIIALIIWLIYRPSKPQFTAVAATVYSLNVTSPPFISASVQFTILTRNPNKRTAIYYDGLTAAVFYRNQPITPPVSLPPLLQERRSMVLMSPVIGGAAVPVSADVVNGVVAEEAYGVVGLSWVLTGRVRYRVIGGFKSRHSRVYVRCDVLMGFKGSNSSYPGVGGGGGGGGQVPLLGNPQCLVHM